MATTMRQTDTAQEEPRYFEIKVMFNISIGTPSGEFVQDSKSLMMRAKHVEVSPPWAGFIFDGTKKIEICKHTPTEPWYAVDGDLLFVIEKESKEKGTPRSQLFVVKDFRVYDSTNALDECYMNEGIGSLLPGKTSKREADEVYLSYGSRDIAKIEEHRRQFSEFGCLAINLVPFSPAFAERSKQWGTLLEDMITANTN